MVQGPTSSDRLRLCAVRSSWPFALQWLIERRDVFLDAYFIQKSRGFLFTYRLSIFPTSVHDAFLTRRSLIAATGDPYLLSPLNARFLSPYLLTCLSGDNACEAVLEFRPINLVPTRSHSLSTEQSLPPGRGPGILQKIPTCACLAGLIQLVRWHLLFGNSLGFDFATIRSQDRTTSPSVEFRSEETAERTSPAFFPFSSLRQAAISYATIIASTACLMVIHATIP
jgi:hypothetical protein